MINILRITNNKMWNTNHNNEFAAIIN